MSRTAAVVLALAVVVGASVLPAHAQNVTCTQSGTRTVCSNGQTFFQSGNQTFDTEGHVWTNLGNQQVGPSGNKCAQVGTQVFCGR